MHSACAESVFRDKNSVPVQQRFLFLDVACKATATMHLGEIVEARGACYIDECCGDLLFTHNDDVWYRENTKSIVSSSSSLMNL